MTVPSLVDLFREISLFAKLTVVVAVGAFALAVAYAVRPTEQKLVLMRPVSLAAIFATLSGLFGGWIAVLTGISATADVQSAMPRIYRGIADSLTVGFVCFGLLAAAWTLVAVGMLRRLTPRLSS
jgi:hypothetical protein